MTLHEKLSIQTEMNPDAHDGAYELVRETVNALANVNPEELGIEDLDMLYLMGIGTWKSSYQKKKEKINKSHLSQSEKNRLLNLVDKLQENAKNHQYENSGNNGSIGMFGTGFFTFNKVSKDDARRFIRLCIEISRIDDDEIIFEKTHEVLKNNIYGMGIASVSEILHYLKPFTFPVLNNSSDAGSIVYKSLDINLLKPGELPFYIQNVKKIKEYRDNNFKFKNYRILDTVLWDIDTDNTKAWLLNVFIKNKTVWDYCKENNCFAMQYEYDVQDNSSVTRNIKVAKDVKIGDYVLAYTGDQKVLAYGIVIKEYYEEKDDRKFISSNEKWAQRIGVRWEKISSEPIVIDDFNKTLEVMETNKLSVQAINQISNTGYKRAVEIINSQSVIEYDEAEDSQKVNYWWLNAKPSIWSFDNINIGEKIEYTSHTDKGTKRNVYKYFDEAKVGDLVIGYETSPTRAIVSLLKVSREHNGETVEFEKTANLLRPIPLDEIRSEKVLGETLEAIQGSIGSFFKVKENEYEIIMEMIEGEEVKTPDVYTKDNLLQEVFISEEKYEDIIYDLEHKKNIILQGPPGVGKTFVAKKLAYSHMKLKDDSKIQMIQFHQNYSYEDFIQGFRPTEDGKFKLKNGIFYDFCKKAQRDKEHNYYFIIDEINRGNLSKIFGELMMLIESDKRGKEYEIPLTYAQSEDDKFYIPDNLYLIGMMNTADRSLAMVDYALRRRFSFISINPAFSTEAFRNFMKEKGIEDFLLNKIITRMEHLNKKISDDNKNLGKGYRIGHSYFCITPKQGESQDKWYRRIILSEIKPLLLEYWFDDEETAETEIDYLLS
ncbi:EVE domain-containing protein [Mobilitalea sibirica]|uniref:EVE domain-containing protein n=1 Tax=Mobilitalea sibirica TaxID=1462919 RepID=A0A8J7H4J3_9FIRM|nr:AAA family ATPase [Mobilitalea sibirica]MBH1939466.1 EVE domain-containing protein [Mobilitalea sibirica]